MSAESSWCEYCAQPFEQRARGRRRKFCKQSCRQRAYAERQGFKPGYETPTIEAARGGWCCYGAAYRGPSGCTCWEPVFDLPVQERPMVGLAPVERPSQCHDCAYRADSPERNKKGMAGFLDEIPGGSGVFFCHDGIREAVAEQHPAGIARRTGAGDYRPPQDRVGIPYRADGLPGFICAGWAARHRHAGEPAIELREQPRVHLC